jgi:hypothetical protein
MKKIIKYGCYALLAVIGVSSWIILLPIAWIQAIYYLSILVFTRENKFNKNPVNHYILDKCMNYR